MTETLKHHSAGELAITEEMVEEYLRQNPLFLGDHAGLLSVLTVPHGQNKGVQSLIERQVEVLRTRNQRSEEQMKSLIDTARDNDSITSNLFTCASILLDVTDIDDLCTGALPRLAEVFDVDKVSLRLKESGPVLLRLDDDDISGMLWERVAQGRGICDDRLPNSVVTLLFGEDSIIKSTALIPFKSSNGQGLIAFGSTDASRFKPEMRTEYLDRLGDLMAALVNRLLGG